MPDSILIAFDKFKDSMTAAEVTEIVAGKVRKRWPEAKVHTTPLTDGGEGFAEILTHQVGGSLETINVRGPRFEPLEAQLGWVQVSQLPDAAQLLLAFPASIERLAVVEMAQASGIQSVPIDARDARHTTTLGTGQTLFHAAFQKADAILLGVGGSATSDMGLGALQVMGFELLDATGAAIENFTPAAIERIATIRPPKTRLTIPVRIACDVTNPLTGPNGAAHVFGPQKGLSQDFIPSFDQEIGRVGALLAKACGLPEDQSSLPGDGAAGGIAYGLRVALEAQIVPGFDLVRSWLQLDTRLAEADLVFTGEGKWDSSSLDGKGPFSVIEAVMDRSMDVYLIGGVVEAEAAKSVQSKMKGTLNTLELRNPEWSLPKNLENGPERLRELLKL